MQILKFCQGAFVLRIPFILCSVRWFELIDLGGQFGDLSFCLLMLVLQVWKYSFLLLLWDLQLTDLLWVHGAHLVNIQAVLRLKALFLLELLLDRLQLFLFLINLTFEPSHQVIQAPEDFIFSLRILWPQAVNLLTLFLHSRLATLQFILEFLDLLILTLELFLHALDLKFKVGSILFVLISLSDYFLAAGIKLLSDTIRILFKLIFLLSQFNFESFQLLSLLILFLLQTVQRVSEFLLFNLH